MALREAVEALLLEENLLAEGPSLLVAHPIRKGTLVRGRSSVIHHPAFVQENGELSVIEPVDFTGRHKRRARDHAGWCAYMFRDIKEDRARTEAIAIVRHTEEDAQNEDVAPALTILRRESTATFNWLDPDQRVAFARERKRIAEARI